MRHYCRIYWSVDNGEKCHLQKKKKKKPRRLHFNTSWTRRHPLSLSATNHEKSKCIHTSSLFIDTAYSRAKWCHDCPYYHHHKHRKLVFLIGSVSLNSQNVCDELNCSPSHFEEQNAKHSLSVGMCNGWCKEEKREKIKKQTWASKQFTHEFGAISSFCIEWNMLLEPLAPLCCKPILRRRTKHIPLL